MPAKILIKRAFLKDKTQEIVQLLAQLRTGARNQEGYITGETLQEHNNPQKTVVISTWDRIENWFNWKQSPQRKQLEAMLEIYQEGHTEYEEYVSAPK